jgi:1-acyl-sn-glycerol-3-phosphate acyltransferase
MPAMVSLVIPPVGNAVPRRGWFVGRAIGRLILSIARWSFEGEIPNLGKGVMIVAPHTSNWDFVIGVGAMLALDLDLRFLGKHTLFKGPLAPLMRGLGGIPVDRNRAGARVVEDMTRRFQSDESLILALSPEGTRSAVDRWKTGFHRIALTAGVPILAVALDYGTRQIRFGPVVEPTKDLERDLAVFYEFFAGMCGRRGNLQLPIS